MLDISFTKGKFTAKHRNYLIYLMLRHTKNCYNSENCKAGFTLKCCKLSKKIYYCRKNNKIENVNNALQRFYKIYILQTIPINIRLCSYIICALKMRF